jgi:RsiW-degrading membrane proteinase PrsW (M82 family)
LPTVRCDHCGREVPEGVFCTNCGAHTGTREPANLRRRVSYAPHPGEHVLQPAILTTILPHLGQRKVHEFRWVFLGGLTGVFVLFLAGLITAALCVSVLLLPLLYALYIYEAQVYKEEPLPVAGALGLLGIGIGIGVTIGTDRLVSSEGTLSFTVTGGSLAITGVVVPLIQEAVKPLPAVALRVRPAFRDETMDGLVFGVAAGLGFGVGESFVRFANVLTDLPVRSTPGTWIYPLVTTAVLLPLLQGTATGILCAAGWRVALGGADAIALAGVPVAVGGHVAFSTVTQVLVNHGWSQLVILAWQAAVVVVLLLFMRVLLHRALLEEAGGQGSADRYCAHCDRTVGAEGFCPTCGMALTAVPFHMRGAGRTGPAAEEA